MGSWRRWRRAVADDLVVNVFQMARLGADIEVSGGPVMGMGGQGLPQDIIGEQGANMGGERGNIADWRQEASAGVHDGFDCAGIGVSDDGRAPVLSFDKYQAEGFVTRGHAEQASAGHEVLRGLAGLCAMELGGDAELFRLLLEVGAFGAFANNIETWREAILAEAR